MRIVSINSVPYGSTAKIMIGISEVAKEKGHEAYTASGYSTHPIKEIPEGHIQIGNALTKAMHMMAARVTGMNGSFSHISTAQLIRKMKKINPDIIHLHNLHGWFINLPMLFSYIKKNQIKVIWTLHDCWSFTGHCPYFDMAECDKWKKQCGNCPQYRQYPQSYIDDSRTMYEKKKKWFTGIKDLTIITPSEWLARLVKESFLRDYPVMVIHNGIDLEVFKPTEGSFRERYHCKDKKIILGVAFDWDERKGLDVFAKLAAQLDNNYQIVLVGTNDEIDKSLPDNIITIHRTQNQSELAEIYTAADLFVIPTREDNYPTVNMEAIACGTPVITFRTGGSPEMPDDTCGFVVEKNDIAGLKEKIEFACEKNCFTKEACLRRAKTFDMRNRFQEYTEIYRS